MKSKKMRSLVSILTAIACILALAAGISGYSRSAKALEEKREKAEKLEARLAELDEKLLKVEDQKKDYEALEAAYAEALEEYNEELEEHQAILQDYEGSVLNYNQGLVGGAGLEQLTLALSLSGNINMTWDRNELAKSRTAYERGLKEYEAAKSAYDEARKQLSNGRYAYQQGLAQLEEAKKQIDEGQKKYDSALKAYNIAYGTYSRIVGGYREVEDHSILHQLTKNTITGQIRDSVNDKIISDTTAQFEKAKADLDAAGAQLAQAQAVVNSGESQISAASPQLAASEKQIGELKSKLDAGLTELNAAKEMLDAKAAEKGAKESALPEVAQPEDSELRKAQVELSNLEHIGAIDESLLTSPDGLDQAEAIIKNNEMLLTNNKARLEEAKKELDNYEATGTALRQGCEQLVSDGYAAEGKSSRETIASAQKQADKLSSYCARRDIANVFTVVLMAASAVFGLLTILAMLKKPEKLMLVSLAAFGTALIGTVTGGFRLPGIVTVLLMFAAAVIVNFADRASHDESAEEC